MLEGVCFLTQKKMLLMLNPMIASRGSMCKGGLDHMQLALQCSSYLEHHYLLHTIMTLLKICEY
jgi:hypothetical protein